MSEVTEKIAILDHRVTGLEEDFVKLQDDQAKDREDRNHITTNLKLLTAQMETHNDFHAKNDTKGYNNKILIVAILALFVSPLITIFGTNYVNSIRNKPAVETTVTNNLPD